MELLLVSHHHYNVSLGFRPPNQAFILSCLVLSYVLVLHTRFWNCNRKWSFGIALGSWSSSSKAGLCLNLGLELGFDVTHAVLVLQ